MSMNRPMTTEEALVALYDVLSNMGHVCRDAGIEHSNIGSGAAWEAMQVALDTANSMPYKLYDWTVWDDE